MPRSFFQTSRLFNFFSFLRNILHSKGRRVKLWWKAVLAICGELLSMQMFQNYLKTLAPDPDVWITRRNVELWSPNVPLLLRKLRTSICLILIIGLSSWLSDLPSAAWYSSSEVLRMMINSTAKGLFLPQTGVWKCASIRSQSDYSMNHSEALRKRSGQRVSDTPECIRSG